MTPERKKKLRVSVDSGPSSGFSLDASLCLLCCRRMMEYIGFMSLCFVGRDIEMFDIFFFADRHLYWNIYMLIGIYVD